MTAPTIDAEWVTLGPEPWLATCERCGTLIPKPSLPASFDAVLAYLAREREAHLRCRPSLVAVPTAAQAEHARDNGIRASGGRAGDDWIEDAVDALDAFGLSSFPDPFLVEDVREWAAEHRPQLSPAPDPRAWGAVVRVVKSRGMIAQVGYRAARSSRMGPKALWRYVPAEYRQ